MNPIDIFFAPEKAVKEALDKPNMAVAIFLIIMPMVLSVIYAMLLGFNVTLNSFNMFAKDVVIWVIGVIIFYFLLMIFKGKKANLSFYGIFAATSLIKAIQVAAMTVFLIAMFLFGQQYLDTAKGMISSGQDISNKEVMSQLQNIEVESTMSLLIGSSIVFVIFLLLFFLGVYVFYKIVDKTGKSTFIGNLLILFIYFVILGVLTRFFG